MRRARVAIIGSCVTRDVWNLAGYEDDDRPDLLYLARTSFASLTAAPLKGFTPPPGPPGDLTAWEARMVADDILKRGLGKLAAYRPTHLILDFIDERFNLLRRGATVINHSWELHRAGYDAAGPAARLTRVGRGSQEAKQLWTAGFTAFADWLAATLPQTRIIFHDARWADDYLDEAGARGVFDRDRELWADTPVNIDQQNAVLDGYSQLALATLRAPFRVRAPATLQLADARHRWGLSPFHYVQGYYHHVWNRFRELGCAD